MTATTAGMRVIVTGAAGGVGKATVAKLRSLGARICATDIDPAVKDLTGLDGGDVLTLAADITQVAEVDRIFCLAEDTFGGVDCVVSNAATIVTKSILDTSEEEWDRILDTNAKSLFLVLKRALPGMIAAHAGSIVATASISSVVGLPTQAAYAASKGAVLQLIRQTAVEYAGTGVRINAVGPGSITRTKILDDYLGGLDDPAAGAEAVKSAHPIGRWAQPEEIADAIAFLAGPESSFVTGQILMVDGGYHGALRRGSGQFDAWPRQPIRDCDLRPLLTFDVVRTMRKHPSLKSVQAFEAAARLGSFTAAAQELCVTASAISHQIRFLEQEVGVALFHRTSRAVVLTDVGARYAQHIGEALSQIESATRDIERRDKADILTIHSVPSFAAQWLMPRLARFSAQHSSIDVRLNASVGVVDLSAGAIDVDIRYGSVLAANGVVTLPLPEERIVALSAPDLARAGAHPIRVPADLRQHTLIHSEVNLFNWRAFARQHDVVLDLERGPRFDRSFMAISAAVDRLGICLESQLLVQREIESGRLVVLFDDSPKMSCHSLCILKSKLTVPKIRAFREWLFDELQQPLLG